MSSALNIMDIAYYCFIALVIIAGITAIIILCPKENRLRQEKKDCYRFKERDGRLFLTKSKPGLFEKRFGKPIYIEKGPFELEIFADSVIGADEKSYRMAAIFQVYLPESGAEQAGEYFYSVLSSFSQQDISEALKNELETAVLQEAEKYSENSDNAVFVNAVREAALKKLGVFGYDLYSNPTVKITPNNRDG